MYFPGKCSLEYHSPRSPFCFTTSFTKAHLQTAWPRLLQKQPRKKGENLRAPTLASGKYDHTNQSTQSPPGGQSYAPPVPIVPAHLRTLSFNALFSSSMTPTRTWWTQMSDALVSLRDSSWYISTSSTSWCLHSQKHPSSLFGAFGRSLGTNETPNSPSGIRSGEPNSTSRPRWSISYWCSWYLVFFRKRSSFTTSHHQPPAAATTQAELFFFQLSRRTLQAAHVHQKCSSILKLIYEVISHHVTVHSCSILVHVVPAFWS